MSVAFLEITTYNAAELEAFVNSEAFTQLKDLPISRHRAISHVRNPRLYPEKNLLYVAYDNDEVVGYRLMLCDTIYLNNVSKPIAWFSCVWVHPGMRGRGVAKKMMQRVLSEWGDDIVYSNPVVASRDLYLSLGFKGPISLKGARGYFRSNLRELFPKRFPKLKTIQPFFAAADVFLNTLRDGQLCLGRKRYDRPYGLMEVPEVDDELATFIAEFQKSELFRRNKAELNWITQYPWIHSGKPTDESKRYYFSSVDRKFQFRHFKIINENKEVIAYLLLAVRNEALFTPYLYFQPQYVEVVYKAVLHLLRKERLSTFTTYHPVLADYVLHNRKSFMVVKSMRRDYYAAEKFLPYFSLNPPNFMDGDGDQAFT